MANLIGELQDHKTRDPRHCDDLNLMINYEVGLLRRRKRRFRTILSRRGHTKVPSPRRPSKDPTGSVGDDQAYPL